MAEWRCKFGPVSALTTASKKLKLRIPIKKSCSSLHGLLQENGPFLWQANQLKPRSNPWSWHLLTNIVYVDQPVGTGFATGNVSAQNEDDVARQFLGFWKNFVTLFGMEGYKVYVVSESYGGYHGSYISSHMVNAQDKRHFDLGGLMIYDGLLFPYLVQFEIPVESYIDHNRNLLPLSDLDVEEVRNLSSKCGYRDYYKKYLTYPPSGPAPFMPPDATDLSNGSFEWSEDCFSGFHEITVDMAYTNPCFNEFNIADHCPTPHNPLDDKEPFFNREDVKKAIHAPLDVQWKKCINEWSDVIDQSSPPDKYELPNVINATSNVILAHGAMDFAFPLDGVLLGLQNMTWGGQLGFQKAPSDPFYVPRYNDVAHGGPGHYAEDSPAGYGVQGTVHHERGLTLVVTQLAGNPGPTYSPAGSMRHLEKLLGRVKSMSGLEPFTIPELQGFSQATVPLGQGTANIPFRSAN